MVNCFQNVNFIFIVVVVGVVCVYFTFHFVFISVTIKTICVKYVRVRLFASQGLHTSTVNVTQIHNDKKSMDENFAFHESEQNIKPLKLITRSISIASPKMITNFCHIYSQLEKSAFRFLWTRAILDVGSSCTSALDQRDPLHWVGMTL